LDLSLSPELYRIRERSSAFANALVIYSNASLGYFTDSVEVDTSKYDNMLNQVWDKFSEPAGSKLGYFDKEDFENYMCKYLV